MEDSPRALCAVCNLSSDASPRSRARQGECVRGGASCHDERTIKYDDTTSERPSGPTRLALSFAVSLESTLPALTLQIWNEPRGKQKAGTESAGEPQAQSSSTEDPAAVPSAEPVPSTSADGDSGTASAEAIPEGTGGPEAPTPAPAAVGEDPTAVGDVTPSKPTRKELAVRARQRKLQAIVEAYRRLVAQAEEEEEAAAAAAASSNAPAPKPAGVRRRGQAAARRRIFSSSAAPPHNMHASVGAVIFKKRFSSG
ncbi:uncharacterized protein LOC144821643 [Lissotriton helveticus]